MADKKVQTSKQGRGKTADDRSKLRNPGKKKK